MQASDLLNRLEDRPFQAFRIHMSDGPIFEVLNPGMVVVGETSAVLPRGFSRDEEGRTIATGFRTISLPHIVQFSNIDTPTNGRKRSRRR